MMNAKEYFLRYLGYQMGMISNDNMSMHNIFYESYRNLDDRVLLLHAETENNPGALQELGERKFFFDNDADAAIPYLEKASELGNGEATLVLAQIYKTSKNDFDNYFKYLELASNQGCGMAMYNLSCSYYKGREAYDGHGFDQDRLKAWDLSYGAAQRLKELLEVMTSVKCAKSFQDFFNQLISVYVQSLCTSVEQIIDGVGIDKDLPRAKRILLDENAFFNAKFGCDCRDFVRLINEIDSKM